MPIYEYLCPTCNRIYSFLSRSAAGEHRPTCPRCGATNLEKRVSRFAFVRGAGTAGGKPTNEEGPPGGPPGEGADFDDPRVEREMMRLMRDAEHMDENDPKQIAQFMRRMSSLTGESLDPEMEEAVRRLESGEDPEKIEEEMGDLLGGPDDMDYGGMGYGGEPSYDEGLYPMD
jgi:putative FmdB family regulatory protein